MPRAPCCEKMGLKKGPWTREEDQILIDYVQNYGHANWRALPKQAGLLRCGKSCRLRWINYLRPDLKRGNFSPQEEDAIINLHQSLGNRWSAIAAKLPGRTDNEIKNVWHTHLKKRVGKKQASSSSSRSTSEEAINDGTSQSTSAESFVAQQSCSSSSEVESDNNTINDQNMDMFESFPEMDESFWLDSIGNCSSNSIFLPTPSDIDQLTWLMDSNVEPAEDAMNFWYNVFLRAQD